MAMLFIFFKLIVRRIEMIPLSDLDIQVLATYEHQMDLLEPLVHYMKQYEGVQVVDTLSLPFELVGNILDLWNFTNETIGKMNMIMEQVNLNLTLVNTKTGDEVFLPPMPRRKK